MAFNRGCLSLSGGLPIWLCAESRQCTDSFFGGEGNRIDVQTVRLAGNLRGDGENQIQGCVIAAFLCAAGAAHVLRAEEPRVDIVQTGRIDPPRVAACQFEAFACVEGGDVA